MSFLLGLSQRWKRNSAVVFSVLYASLMQCEGLEGLVLRVSLGGLVLKASQRVRLSMTRSVVEPYDAKSR